MAAELTLSAASRVRRVPAPVMGAAAGIATGIVEVLLVRAIFPSLTGLPAFPAIAFTVALLGLGVAAAVSVAVMRALTPSTPRAVRVPVSGVEVRLANLMGRLVNISATGALVSVNGILPLGSEWPLLLQLHTEPVELWTRIVRVIEPVSVDAGALERPEYAVGLMFGDLPPPARQAVAQLCGDAFNQSE